MKRIFICGGAVCLLLVCGCRSFNAVEGFPHNEFDSRKNLKQRYTHFNNQDYENKYYAADDATKPGLRDGYIHDRQALIDAEYVIFIQKLSGVKNDKDFAKSVAIGTMGVVGGLVGGGTAQTLSAASGAASLTDTAIDSVFFYNATLPAIKAGMDAARATVLVKIAQGLTNTIGDYNLSSAEADLDAYYFAGTLLGASSQIQSDSAQKTAKATQQASLVKASAALSAANKAPGADAATIKANSAAKKAIDEKFNSLQ